MSNLKNHLNEQKKKEIIEMHEDGVSKCALARFFNVSPRTVYNIVQFNKTQRKKRNNSDVKLKEQDKIEIRRMAEAGDNLKMIQQKINANVCRTTIDRFLKKDGCKTYSAQMTVLRNNLCKNKKEINQLKSLDGINEDLRTQIQNLKERNDELMKSNDQLKSHFLELTKVKSEFEEFKIQVYQEEYDRIKFGNNLLEIISRITNKNPERKSLEHEIYEEVQEQLLNILKSKRK